MKKIILGLIIIFLFTGCSLSKQSAPVNVALPEQPQLNTPPKAQPPAPTETKKEYTVLRVKKSDGSYEVLTKEDMALEYYTSNRRWASWGDYVFFAGDGDNLIYSYNVKTEQKTVIFDLNKEFRSQKTGNMLSVFNHFAIFNETLYLFFGEYKSEGGLYWLDLPPQGTAKVISRESYPNLIRLNNLLWLTSGFGDACFGSGNYSLFDPITKKVGTAVNYTFECGDGNLFIGLNKENQFISPVYKNFPKDKNDTSPDSFCQSVNLIDGKTGQAQVLISETQMPEKIVDVAYNAKTNELRLSGDKSYLYNLNTKKMAEITDSKILESSDFINHLSSQDLGNESQTLPAGVELITQEIVSQ